MNPPTPTIAIILAAGSSVRCGFDKLFTDQFGDPPLWLTLGVFQQVEAVDGVILVVHPDKLDALVRVRESFPKITRVIVGGGSRFDSLKQALDTLDTTPESPPMRVVVHNGANTALSPEELSHALNMQEYDNHGRCRPLIFGYFTPNAIKFVLNNKVIQKLNREEIFETQTPQIADASTLIQAAKMWEADTTATPADEAELLLHMGEEVRVFACSPANRKLTWASDFERPDYLRIGVGRDAHPLKEGSDKLLILGGITFPEAEFHIAADSDGDIVLHALTDALLSSIGDRTIDSFAGDMCRAGGTDSRAYVSHALARVKDLYTHYAVHQVIITLEGKRPRIAPHHVAIQKSVADILGVELHRVGLTYTTGDGLTAFGRGEGIFAQVFLVAHAR